MLRDRLEQGLFSLVIAAAVLTGRHALAQEGAAAHEKIARRPQDEAEARFQDGTAYARRGDFEGARIAFTEAYAVYPTPRILFNVALAEERTGRTLDALGHFRAIARDETALERDRADAARHVATLSPQVGHVAVFAPSGTLVILDDRGAPFDPSTFEGLLDVAPGRHRIRAQLRDGTHFADVDVGPGTTARIDFRAAERSPEPPRASAAVRAAAVATHTAARTVTQAVSPIQPQFADHRRQGLLVARVATVSAIGVAALATIGGGVYAGLASRSNAATAEQIRTSHAPDFCAGGANASPCAQLQSAINDANNEAAWSNRLYVAGGVLAAAALATWFLWPSSHAQGAKFAWILPSMARHSATLGIASTW